MPTEFATKRPHKKSRGGCKICKSKKIKCDEVLPSCGFCVKRNLTCEYLPRPARHQPLTHRSIRSASDRNPSETSSPTPSSEGDVVDIVNPPPSLIPGPGQLFVTARQLTPNDIRTMHFWSVFTSQTVTPGNYASELFQVIIPQLAFEHSYLLDVMLGITSLHMQSLIPDSDYERQQTALYRTNAFSGFRQALSKLDPSKLDQWQAALTTSIMLTLLCAKDYEVEDGDLIALRWVYLYRGLSTVISMGKFEQVIDSRIGPLFRRSFTDLKSDPVVPYYLYQMIEFIPEDDQDHPHLASLKKMLDLLGVLYATLREEGASSSFTMRTLSWASTLGPQITDFVKEMRPRMIVLLAHYMVFVKCMTQTWWVEGVADGDIRRVFRMLPPRWFPLLDIPRKALDLEDQADLTSLLLNSVDPDRGPVVKTSVREYPHAVKWYAPSKPEDHGIECD